MVNDKDRTGMDEVEILDLDEPDEPQTPAQEQIPPPPDWDPKEPIIIDVNGYIHIRGGRFFESRVVGKIKGETGQATVAALMERFQELERRFDSLERELRGSRNLVRNIKSAQSFLHWVEGAEAIGDFPTLLEKTHALIEDLESKLTQSRSEKEALIARCETLQDSTSWSRTSQELDDIMNEWKRCGSGGGTEDDELWERFREVRGRFYARKSEHHADMKKARSEARKAKEDLIERSAALAGSTDWERTFDDMQALMEEWKQAGSAGRKADDELWERFREVREPFFAGRREYLKKQRPQRDRDRRPRGRGPRPNRPPTGGQGRTRSTGTLHASLAEILGPMKDLYPDKDDPKKKKGKKSDK